MTLEASRRAVLRGSFTEDRPDQPSAPRPLGAVSEAAFAEACTGCGDCARACPEHLIRRDSAGLPVMVFTETACTGCGACLAPCPAGALTLIEKSPATETLPC